MFIQKLCLLFMFIIIFHIKYFQGGLLFNKLILKGPSDKNIQIQNQISYTKEKAIKSNYKTLFTIFKLSFIYPGYQSLTQGIMGILRYYHYNILLSFHFC